MLMDSVLVCMLSVITLRDTNTSNTCFLYWNGNSYDVPQNDFQIESYISNPDGSFFIILTDGQYGPIFYIEHYSANFSYLGMTKWINEDCIELFSSVFYQDNFFMGCELGLLVWNPISGNSTFLIDNTINALAGNLHRCFSPILSARRFAVHRKKYSYKCVFIFVPKYDQS